MTRVAAILTMILIIVIVGVVFVAYNAMTPCTVTFIAFDGNDQSRVEGIVVTVVDLLPEGDLLINQDVTGADGTVKTDVPCDTRIQVFWGNPSTLGSEILDMSVEDKQITIGRSVR